MKHGHLAGTVLKSCDMKNDFAIPCQSETAFINADINAVCGQIEKGNQSLSVALWLRISLSIKCEVQER